MRPDAVQRAGSGRSGPPPAGSRPRAGRGERPRDLPRHGLPRRLAPRPLPDPGRARAARRPGSASPRLEPVQAIGAPEHRRIVLPDRVQSSARSGGLAKVAGRLGVCASVPAALTRREHRGACGLFTGASTNAPPARGTLRSSRPGGRFLLERVGLSRGRRGLPPGRRATDANQWVIGCSMGARGSLPANGARGAAVVSLPRAGSPRSREEAGPNPSLVHSQASVNTPWSGLPGTGRPLAGRVSRRRNPTSHRGARAPHVLKSWT